MHSLMNSSSPVAALGRLWLEERGGLFLVMNQGVEVFLDVVRGYPELGSGGEGLARGWKVVVTFKMGEDMLSPEFFLRKV